MSRKVILYRHKTYADGRHPIMIQDIVDGKVKRFTTGVTAFPKEWSNGRLNEKHENHEEGNLAIDRAYRKKESTATPNVCVFILTIVDELRAKGKEGNARKYEQLHRVFSKFAPTITFKGLNYKRLKDFEIFLFERGSGNGGVRFNMRTIRAAYNEAIRRGYVDKELYPFSTQFNKQAYSLAHLRTDYTPTPLTKEEFELIKEVGSLYSDTFVFSVYSRGINFVDLAEIKRSSIINGRFSYYRKKTGTSYDIRITERMQAILDKYDSEYLLPLITRHDYGHIRWRLRKYNDYMKALGEELGIKTKITSYTARYTFVELMVQNGLDVNRISQALGHSKLSTTQHYIKKFQREVLDDIDDIL